MRTAWTAAFGIAITLAAFGASRLVGGFSGAAMFVVAVAAIPVTLGLAIGNAWPDNVGRSRPTTVARNWISRRGLRRPLMAELARCGQCGRARAVMESVWVCSRCDHVVARS